MPIVRFTKSEAQLDVPVGSNLMQALLEGGRPVASSCQGDGVCGKCRIEIVDGRKNLSPETELEKFLRERHLIPKEMRVSCQTQILGDITVNASYW